MIFIIVGQVTLYFPNAVIGKTVLAGESSDFHVRKLGSAELIARMCSAFLAPYSP